MDAKDVSMHDIAVFMAKDLMNTTNEKSVEVKAKAVAQMYTNIQAQWENEIRDAELELKRAELEMKERIENERLAREEELAKKTHRLEIAKVCITGVTTLFTISLVAISCAKGDLGFKALKDIRLPFKTL